MYSEDRTSSFELPAEYFADALGKLQRNDTIRRGEIGVDLELVSIGESIKILNYQNFLVTKSAHLEVVHQKL